MILSRTPSSLWCYHYAKDGCRSPIMRRETWSGGFVPESSTGKKTKQAYDSIGEFTINVVSYSVLDWMRQRRAQRNETQAGTRATANALPCR